MKRQYTVEGKALMIEVTDNFDFRAEWEGIKFHGPTPQAIIDQARNVMQSFDDGAISVVALNNEGDVVVLRGVHKKTRDYLITKNGAKAVADRFSRFYSPEAQDILTTLIAKRAECELLTTQLAVYRILFDSELQKFIVPTPEGEHDESTTVSSDA